MTSDLAQQWFDYLRYDRGRSERTIRTYKSKFEWAEDQVVMVKFRNYPKDEWNFAIRATDGGWVTRDDTAGFSADELADLYEVRRLSPEARAELLGTMRGEQA